MLCGIYAIRRKSTNQKYYGSSTDIPSRLYMHRLDLDQGTHVNPKLQAAWSHDGPSGFEFLLLEECDEAVLLEREQWYLDNEVDWDFDFNANRVADRPPSWKGRHHSETTREKMRQRQLGRKMPPVSDEYREQARQRMLGNDRAKKPQRQPRSEEHREKLRQAGLHRAKRPYKARPQQSESLKASWQKRKQAKG